MFQRLFTLTGISEVTDDATIVVTPAIAAIQVVPRSKRFRPRPFVHCLECLDGQQRKRNGFFFKPHSHMDDSTLKHDILELSIDKFSELLARR